jgi:hypothetical protein
LESFSAHDSLHTRAYGKERLEARCRRAENIRPRLFKDMIMVRAIETLLNK